MLDYRYRDQSVVAETNETVFVHDEVRDKVTRWLVKATTGSSCTCRRVTVSSHSCGTGRRPAVANLFDCCDLVS